jgi:hypothetical protein
MDKLEEVRAFAKAAHAGQLYDGKDYFTTHVVDVAFRVGCHPGATTQHIMAAYLHDVLEDCDVTLVEVADLLGPYNLVVLDAVLRLTKNPNDHYLDYMAGIVHSPIATIVKYHDSSANYAYGGREKYAKNIAFLERFLPPIE